MSKHRAKDLTRHSMHGSNTLIGQVPETLCIGTPDQTRWVMGCGKCFWFPSCRAQHKVKEHQDVCEYQPSRFIAKSFADISKLKTKVIQ